MLQALRMKIPALANFTLPAIPGLPASFALKGPLNHQALSVSAFAALSLTTLAAVQFLGDPNAARPKKVISLNSAAGAPAFHAPLSAVVVDPMNAGEAGDPNLGYGATDGSDLADTGAAPPPSPPLVAAPIPKLTARGPMGLLPIIAADGTTPRGAYKRPFTGDTSKPRIGVIVGGLGFNAAVTQSAIDDLPADVTLSFVPYADNLQGWINAARAKGHEVLMELPMEPFDSDSNDTGPQTLLASGAAKDNVAKLENLLSRGTGYFGVSNYQGAKFAMSDAATAPVVKALKDRGLEFVSNGIGQRAALSTQSDKAGLPFTAADRVLDTQRDGDAINDELLNLETLAQQSGASLGAGFAFPVTINQIRTWAASLPDRGYVLAPASAIVDARAAKH